MLRMKQNARPKFNYSFMNTNNDELEKIINFDLVYDYVKNQWGTPLTEKKRGDITITIVKNEHLPENAYKGVARLKSIYVEYSPSCVIDVQRLSWLLIHELIHLWIGLTIERKECKSNWCFEGLTNFYSTLVQLELGIIDKEVFDKVINITQVKLLDYRNQSKQDYFDKKDNYIIHKGVHLFYSIYMKYGKKFLDGLIKYLLNYNLSNRISNRKLINMLYSKISDVDILKMLEDLT